MSKRAWFWLGLTFCAIAATAAGAGETITADGVMRHAEERFQKLTDYECFIDTDSQLGRKQETGTYHLWFKKPRLMRTHVEAGRNHGSDVILQANGQIRGREGGLLKPFAVRLKLDDSRIRSIRGVSVTALDWGSFYQAYRSAATKLGARTALQPHPDPRAPFEVTVNYPEAGKRVREVYHIDPERWVMVEGDQFEDGARVDHAVFRDIRIDTGVSDRWFRF